MSDRVGATVAGSNNKDLIIEGKFTKEVTSNMTELENWKRKNKSISNKEAVNKTEYTDEDIIYFNKEELQTIALSLTLGGIYSDKILGENITIATNGKVIDDEIVQKLSDLGIGSVLVSLDGHDAKTAKTFRNMEGTYDYAINAIKKLTDKNIKVRIGVVIWKGNEDFLEDLPENYHKYWTNFKANI